MRRFFVDGSAFFIIVSTTPHFPSLSSSQAFAQKIPNLLKMNPLSPKKMKIRILITAATLLSAGNSFAAAVASDNASAWAYDALPNEWVTGDNGGYGWGAWTLTTTGGGHFIGSSTGNGDGVDDGIFGGMPSDGDINSTVGPAPDQSGDPDPHLTVGRAWGMYANGGGVTNAFRSFTSGSMTVGQTFSMDFDNGHINTGGTVGLGLLNAAGATLWEIYFKGGNANYFNRDASGEVATTVGYGDEGLNVSFTLTGAAAYSMILTRRDGVAQTITGTLIGEVDQNISQVRAFNANAGGGGPHDAFYNNMTLVPEPSSSALGLLGAVLLLRRRRD